MGIELNQFLNYVGIESTDEMSQEDLHNAFAEKFVKRDNATQDESIVKSVIGKHLGSLDTNIRKIARDNGVDIPDELKNAKVEDLLGHTFKGMKSTYETKLGELSQQIDNADLDAIKGQYEEKYSKLESKYNDTLGLLDNTKTQFEKFKSEKDNEIKNFKLSTTLSKHYADAKYKSDITDIEKVGFKTYMDNKYVTDFDETGSPYMALRQNGERVKNEQKMGEFMTIPEIIQLELSTQKLMSVNNQAESGNGNGQKKKLGSALNVQPTTSVQHAQNVSGQSRTISRRAQR